MIDIEPKFDIYTILLLIGMVQGVFLAYFFLINRKNISSNIFGILILVLTLSLTEIFLNYSGLLFSVLHLLDFSEPLQLLIGPLFFLYIFTLTNRRLSLIAYLHFLPFLFYSLYLLNAFSMPIEQKYNSYIAEYFPNFSPVFIEQYQDPDPWKIRGFITNFGIFIHLLGYFIASIVLVKDELNTQTTTFFSKNRSPIQKKWIQNFFILAIIGIILFPLSKYLFGIVNAENFIGIYLTFFIYTVGYFVIKESLFITQNQSKKYANSSLSEERSTAKIEQLLEIMEQEKPYLSNSFSMPDLAARLKISEHHLSQLINEKLGTNYFGMINHYRAIEAKRILDNPENENLTIEQIAYDVGYNSKSSFFTAFKKEFNITPHAYRKNAKK